MHFIPGNVYQHTLIPDHCFLVFETYPNRLKEVAVGFWVNKENYVAFGHKTKITVLKQHYGLWQKHNDDTTVTKPEPKKITKVTEQDMRMLSRGDRAE